MVMESIVFHAVDKDNNIIGQFDNPATEFSPEDNDVNLTSMICQGHENTLVVQTDDGPTGINDITVIWTSPVFRMAHTLSIK